MSSVGNGVWWGRVGGLLSHEKCFVYLCFSPVEDLTESYLHLFRF